MRTTTIKRKGAPTVYVHHNPDWSGEVIIEQDAGGDGLGSATIAQMDAKLFMKIARTIVEDDIRNSLIATFEQWGNARKDP